MLGLALPLAAKNVIMDSQDRTGILCVSRPYSASHMLILVHNTSIVRVLVRILMLLPCVCCVPVLQVISDPPMANTPQLTA